MERNLSQWQGSEKNKPKKGVMKKRKSFMGRRKFDLKEQREKREKVNWEGSGKNEKTNVKRWKTKGIKGKEKLVMSVFGNVLKENPERKGESDNERKGMEGRITWAKKKKKNHKRERVNDLKGKLYM